MENLDILIASGSYPLRNQLKMLLWDELRTSDVYTVATAEGGKIEIQGLAEKGREFDILILEFDHPNKYEKLCLLVNSEFPDALVVHLEATKGDKEAQFLFQHLANLHTEPDTSRSLVVSKHDPEWGTMLLTRLKHYLYERQMDVIPEDNLSQPFPGPS